MTGVPRATPATHPVSVTIDVEDHTATGGERRFVQALQPLLDGLAASGTRATFFVVGELAPEWADELRRLDADGHEIGLHGHTHRFLSALGPDQFANELARGRDTLAGILGHPPAGFRAPYFSLTAKTPWAPDIIASAGFTYSSSVLPAWNPQAGMPSAPRRPFLWSSGLVEFPSPVYGLGPLALPVLGGAYIRLVPQFVVDRATRSAGTHRGAWSYSHPYDFDVDEPFGRRDGQSWIVAKIIFARRRVMLARVLRLAKTGSTTLGLLAADASFVSGLETHPHA